MTFLPKIDNLRSFLTTGVGVGLAQLIALFSVPLIARMSGPEVFGEFSYYHSIVIVLCVFTSLKLEFSVFNVSWRIYPYLKVFVAWLLPVTAVLFGCLASWFLVYKGGIDTDEVSLLTGAFILMLLGICRFEFFIQDNIRKGAFKRNAMMRISRAVLLPVVFLFLSWLSEANPAIVILSFALANIIGSGFKIKFINPTILLKKKLWLQVLTSCKRVIIFLVPSHFLSRYSAGCFILISGILGLQAEDIAKYALVEKLMLAPIAIVTAAVADVVKREIIKDPMKGLSNYFRLSFYSLSIAVLGSIVIVFFGEALLLLLVGEQWVGSGQYAIAFLPYFCAVLVLSPITHVYTVLQKQNYDFIWQLMHALLVSVAIVVGLNEGVLAAIWAFSITAALSILVSALVCVYIVKHESLKRQRIL